MINKLTNRTADEKLESFPDFPPRDDMQNPIHLHLDGHQTMLVRHFGNRDTTLVLGEVPVYWYPSRNARVPDLTIAFNISRANIIDRNGYAIEEHGKPPDFVLEVASVSTARNDYTQKRQDYAAFGIPEYWRFDPTGGRRYDAPLAGDRLVEDGYQPINVIRTDENRLWGHSAVLNLDVCWEYGKLRWWDPAAGRYLETHDEEAEARYRRRGPNPRTGSGTTPPAKPVTEKYGTAGTGKIRRYPLYPGALSLGWAPSFSV